MKRVFAALAASALLLTGCTVKFSGNDETEKEVAVTKEKITALPSDDTMKDTLKNLGYKAVTVGNFEKDGYSLFTATNGKFKDEFEGVMVMRAKDPDDLSLKKDFGGSASVDKIHVYAVKDDPNFGNVVVTGTDNAIKAAGIQTG